MPNKVSIPFAYVVTAPEVRTAQDGKLIARFLLGEKEIFKDSAGNRTERRTTHRIVAFGKLAEIVNQYFKKGKVVYFEGSLGYNRYEKDGVKYSIPELRMTDFEFAPVSSTGNGTATNGTAKATNGQVPAVPTEVPTDAPAEIPEDDFPW
jgi:single-strand DNA-binding protein